MAEIPFMSKQLFSNLRHDLSKHKIHHEKSGKMRIFSHMKCVLFVVSYTLYNHQLLLMIPCGIEYNSFEMGMVGECLIIGINTE